MAEANDASERKRRRASYRDVQCFSSEALMSTIKDVSGTAFVVAEYRAEENREPTPIYKDPVVGLFLSDASRQAAERVSSRFAPVKDMVKTRTRYFDDTLDTQIAAGFGQVVI